MVAIQQIFLGEVRTPSEVSVLDRDSRLFKAINDLDTFLTHQSNTKEPQGYQHFIFEARHIIDAVDPKICAFMANFDLSAKKQPAVELSPKTIEKLDGTPQEFLMALVKYIDFSEMSEELKNRNIQTLAGFVAQRFTAISLVAHGKKLNGEPTSFHSERHENVLSTNARRIGQNNKASPRLCREIFGEFMQAGCDIQDAYINDKAPANTAMPTKLRKIGAIRAL